MKQPLFPISRSVFAHELPLFASFNEDELAVVEQNNLYVLGATDPVRRLLSLEARPGLRDNERRMKAYRVGVVVGATLLRQWAQHTGYAFQPANTWDTVHAVKALAAERSRFVLTQFIEGEEDVKPLLRSALEQPWLRQHVSFLHGSEHQRGHNDYILVGMGDVLMESALREGHIDYKLQPLAISA